MSAAEKPETITVTLTEQQRQHILNGLANELVDVKRYLSGPKPSATPGPMEDCCDGHRARWQRDRDTHRMLTARKKSLKETVALLLYDGEVF